MAALDVKVKRFIVQALACYDTPTQVAAAVLEEFGVKLERQRIAVYDPTKAAGRELSKELRSLFEETRARFKAEADAIPIASQAYRLRALNRMHQRAESVGNMAMSAQLLEQAAKEIGGAYTDRRRIVGDGPGGAVAVHATGSLQAMNDADLEKIARGEPVSTAASGSA